MLKKIARKVTARLSNTRPQFATTDVQIGRNVHFGENVVFNCKMVRIGDGTVIHGDVTVNSTTFEIGDYGTIYDHCFFPGPGHLKIGHNFWLGTASIVDCAGGTVIGNNVGIGAQSQLWTHMKYGDVMYGNRFYSEKPLIVGDDVWLVGHCLVSPVTIGDRSIAFLGSLVTKDMEADHTYAGAPAKDVTDKFGPQFKITTIDERIAYLQARLQEFAQQYHAEQFVQHQTLIATTAGEMPAAAPDVTVFNVADRTYTKRGTPTEHKLMRFLLPDAKFIPAP